jgi:hypothetical protein
MRRYSLGHPISSTRAANIRTTNYSTKPLDFPLPETGSRREIVPCHACREELTILLRSPQAIKTARLMCILYIVAALVVGGLVMYISISQGLFTGAQGLGEYLVGALLFGLFCFIINQVLTLFSPSDKLAVTITNLLTKHKIL